METASPPRFPGARVAFGAALSGPSSNPLWPPTGCFSEGLRLCGGMGTDGTSPSRLILTLARCTLHHTARLVLSVLPTRHYVALSKNVFMTSLYSPRWRDVLPSRTHPVLASVRLARPSPSLHPAGVSLAHLTSRQIPCPQAMAWGCLSWLARGVLCWGCSRTYFATNHPDDPSPTTHHSHAIPCTFAPIACCPFLDLGTWLSKV